VPPPANPTIDASAVVATKDRVSALQRTLKSLAQQSIHPAELIIVDASSDTETEVFCGNDIPGLRSKLCWVKASEQGAASQRNQGVTAATQPVIWFFDDDVLFEPECVDRLWTALKSDEKLGGVNAMIVNQRYQTPGSVSRLMFTLMHGKAEQTFAGKVIGPAINLLPEDRDDLPDIVPVEWLNTTCTMYRREALPNPPFDSFFTGYSLMEDLALSLRVRQCGWNLANVRKAKIFHDSQPALVKSSVETRAAMELINRRYVLNNVLGKNSCADFLRLCLWELFSLISGAATIAGLRELPAAIRGKLRGFTTLHTSMRTE
jgi:GT2 family glycosyltransferase